MRGRLMYVVVYLMFILPSSVIAEIFYVSPDGKGDFCTKVEPCSLEIALYKAQSNDKKDIINLLPGVYEINKRLTYNPRGVIYNASITIKASGDLNNKPILRGVNSCILEINTTSLSNSDKDVNIVIKGIIFENGSCEGDVGGAIKIISREAGIYIRENLFKNNKAEMGGAIYIDGGLSVYIFNNFIYYNEAVHGAGIYIKEENNNPSSYPIIVIHNNTIYNNKAVKLDNTINLTPQGAGIYINTSIPLTLYSYIYIFNNIIYDNKIDILVQSDQIVGKDAYIYLTQGEVLIESNNFSEGPDFIISGDQSKQIINSSVLHVTAPSIILNSNSRYPPYFRNPYAEDFKLACKSILVDLGMWHEMIYTETDFFGEPRTEGQSIDIGADEVNYIPEIYTNTDTVDFGEIDVSIGEEREGLNLIGVKILNRGCGDLNISKIEIKGKDKEAFAIKEENCTNKSIAPGGEDSCVIKVLFKPRLGRKYTAQLHITYNNPYDSRKVVNIKGKGVVPSHLDKPILSAEPNIYDFGTLYVGETKKLKVKVYNKGYKPTPTIEDVFLDNSQDFSIVYETCKLAVIKPDGFCEVEIMFNPKSAGPKNTKLIFNSETAVGTFYGIVLEKKRGNCNYIGDNIAILFLLLIITIIFNKLRGPFFNR